MGSCVFSLSFLRSKSCFHSITLYFDRRKKRKEHTRNTQKKHEPNKGKWWKTARFIRFILFLVSFSSLVSKVCSFFTHNKACVTPLPLPLLWREEERTRTEQQTLQTNQSHTAADRGGWWIVEWKEERRASLSSFLPYPFTSLHFSSLLSSHLGNEWCVDLCCALIE